MNLSELLDHIGICRLFESAEDIPGLHHNVRAADCLQNRRFASELDIADLSLEELVEVVLGKRILLLHLWSENQSMRFRDPKLRGYLLREKFCLHLLRRFHLLLCVSIWEHTFNGIPEALTLSGVESSQHIRHLATCVLNLSLNNI